MADNRSYLVAFWSPFPTAEPNLCISYFSSFFQRYGPIQCLDCRDHRDERTLCLLRQADLVVIALPQNYRKICRALFEDSLRFSNYIYLITDYVSGDSVNLTAIAVEFRIPSSRLASIPYTPRMREAKKWPDRGPLSAEFRRELTRAGQIMLRALGF